jgi:hypothetical protein
MAVHHALGERSHILGHLKSAKLGVLLDIRLTAAGEEGCVHCLVAARENDAAAGSPGSSSSVMTMSLLALPLEVFRNIF